MPKLNVIINPNYKPHTTANHRYPSPVRAMTEFDYDTKRTITGGVLARGRSILAEEKKPLSASAILFRSVILMLAILMVAASLNAN